nr:transcription factor bHLH92 isoform X2 [Malus domestica]
MDRYILKALEGEFLWYDESPPVLLNQSAFVPYTNRPISNQLPNGVAKSMNVNKRMLQFLRKSWQPAAARNEAGEDGRERGVTPYDQRAHEEGEAEAKLLSLAFYAVRWNQAMNIQQLKRYEEELRKKNMELETLLVENEKERVKWTKIRLKVANPTSGIDSTLEVLKCLQHLGLKARNIRSNFSLEEFSAELEIESKEPQR